MAITITNAQVETFESTVRQLAQQTTSRLRSKISEVNKQAKSHNWDRLAASTARAKTSARMVSPAGGNGSGAVGATDGLAWTRRQTLCATYDTGEVIERDDIVQMLIDPKNATTANLVANMNRQVDDIIINAANEVARDGAGGTVALPAGQKIGSATDIISIDTILEADSIFETNDVDPEETKCLVIGPTQKRKLMQLLEVTSGDFQNAKALASGYLPDFMGFDIIVSNRLRNHTTPPTAGELYCLAFTEKAIGLHVAGDISSRVGERTDMSFAWQVYLDLCMDATRVEDEQVVQIHLKDALV